MGSRILPKINSGWPILARKWNLERYPKNYRENHWKIKIRQKMWFSGMGAFRGLLLWTCIGIVEDFWCFHFSSWWTARPPPYCILFSTDKFSSLSKKRIHRIKLCLFLCKSPMLCWHLEAFTISVFQHLIAWFYFCSWSWLQMIFFAHFCNLLLLMVRKNIDILSWNCYLRARCRTPSHGWYGLQR